MNSKCMEKRLCGRAPGFAVVYSVGPRHDLTDAIFQRVRHDVDTEALFQPLGVANRPQAN
ncbi:MAG: hypothetical protein CME46_04360 [Halieaceae bacterium]|nr:hypothetical protein [Halieaceae bacterium]